MPSNLQIEFQSRPKTKWVGWALLGLSIFAVAELDVRRSELEQALGVWRQGDVEHNKEKRTNSGATQDHTAQVVARLHKPWAQLFSGLEKAQIDTVALLSVAPDAQNRSLLLTGEAKGYNELLEYAARLRSEAGLQDVHFTSTEARDDQPQRPVAFAISASWKHLR
jgi:hypothetical protein